MGKYDFDELIDRRGSGCVKYDKIAPELLPMWVADMDFRTPDFILNAIRKRMECPVLGYPFIPDDYFPTIAAWVRNIHGWEVDPAHMCYVPGIVKGIGLAQCALLRKGDKVVIQPPVYHPFRIVSQKNGMEVLFNPLVEIRENGTLKGYRMDFASLEQCFRQGAKMLVLSNPQNPSGQCWDKETLETVAGLAARYGVIVISDEIHAEMVLWGRRHIPYASVCDDAAHGSITFLAPSKTFNIAGVVSSYAIVPDDALRERFFSFMEANELDFPSIFSIETTMAAYRQGAGWRQEMLEYIEGNIDFVCRYLEDNVPQIKALRPQASFLVWLDCTALGISQHELMKRLKSKARLFLNDGTMFGQGGDGFLRLNIACPRSVLEQAMGRLAAIVGE